LIYFLTPDDARPSGGIRQAYLMVDVLRELGYDASVFHGTPGFRCQWFENGTPIVARPFLELEPGDLLVVPEYRGGLQRARCGDAAVVVLNQNHFRTFLGAGFADTWPGDYPGWPNAKAVLATSEAIRRFMQLALRAPLPVHSVRVVVDGERFVPAPKQRKIALLYRKRRPEAESVAQLLARTLPGWRIEPIGEVHQDAVARALGDAAIFLSFSAQEGFGLPPAEAMAAGCYVVGFTGDGGREFMDPQWCSPIGDEDLFAFAEEATRVARLWDDDPAAVQRLADRGREFVTGTYTREKLRDDLQQAFGQIAAPGSDALQRAPVTVTHWSVPLGPRGAVLRAARQMTNAVRSRQRPSGSGS
jgi:hypothetical protein